MWGRMTGAEETLRQPSPPGGFAICQTGVGARRSERINHLVRCNERGGTPGPTVCGLTRFDSKPGVSDADIPGWSMHGGLSGSGVTQTNCPACWTQATG